jgi:hypothetical protein
LLKINSPPIFEQKPFYFKRLEIKSQCLAVYWKILSIIAFGGNAYPIGHTVRDPARVAYNADE